MTFNLVVTPEQLNILLSGLGHIPYMHAQPLLVEIQRQLAEQAPAHNPGASGPQEPASTESAQEKTER